MVENGKKNKFQFGLCILNEFTLKISIEDENAFRVHAYIHTNTHTTIDTEWQ